MALKTDTSVRSKNGVATAHDAPGFAPALASGMRPKKHAATGLFKAEASAQGVDTVDLLALPEEAHAHTEPHTTPVPLEDSALVLASLDPTWYAEPGSQALASDAPKASWFAAPSAVEPAMAQPIASTLAYQTPVPAAPRGPALSSMGSNAIALGLGGLGVGLAAAGGGGGGAAPAPSTPTSTIKVVDGPIRGASVYWDMNDDGKYDSADKLVGKTGADGTLNIATSHLGQHGLLAVGGWNDNGMPNAATLSLAVLTDKSAPLLVVSPLTSLVSAVYLKSKLSSGTGLGFKDAEKAVTAALGIDTGSASLSSLDPTRTDTIGLQLLKAGAVLAGLSAVPQSITASSQDSLASYVLSHSPTGGTLLTQLISSEGMQAMFASKPAALSAAEQATLSLLAGNNTRLLAASSAPGLSDTQIAKPQILGLEYDTGLSATDRITSLPQLSIASLGGTTELSVNNGATWEAASGFAPADGDITVRARSNYGTDSAGKLVVSSSSEAFAFKLQTTVPPTPTIVLGSDTGVSTADRLTNSSLPPVVSATQVNGSVLQYSVDGLLWGVSLSQHQAMLAQDGAHTVFVRQILQDSGVVSATNRLDFTLDTQIASGSAGVLGADDTGALQDDGITSNPQPRLEGRTDPGNTVAFTLGDVAYAVVADGQGYWSFDTPVTAPDYIFDEGRTEVALTVSDAAGNTATTPLKITVTLDTELDIGSAVLLDTSVEATEIYNHTPTLRGTTTEIGASVNVSLEAPDATGTTTQTLFFNTTTVAGSDGLGYWSVVLDTPTKTGLFLQMGEDGVLTSFDYSPFVTITDLAGNTAEDTPRDFTLMPGPDAFGRLSSLDTGRFSDDGITLHTPVSLAGRATPGSVIGLLIDEVTVAENILADAQSGEWSWTDYAESLAEGQYALSLRVDMETGPYAGSSLIILPSLTIDTSAPDASASAGAEIQYSDRVAASTEGSLYFNNLDATGETVLTFSGTAAEAQDYGTTLALYLLKVDAEGATLSEREIDTVSLAMDDGSWSFEWDGLVKGVPAEEGSYFLRARATDVAGNSSTDLLPVALRDDLEQGFAVDNTAPTPVAGAETLDLASRTGADPSYTNLASPTLSGNVDYPDLASVAITVDGTTYGVDTDIAVTLDAATGDWSLTLEALSNGRYDVSLTATDLAGNTSSPVSLSQFTVDTLPEYFSGDPSGEDPTLGSVLGAPVAMLTNAASSVALLPGLVGTVDPTLTSNLPAGLSLSTSGQLSGTPSTEGVTWLAVHSFDLAGNESTTHVQLVVTTGESVKTTLNNSKDTAAKTYSGTTGVDTIKLSASNGDIVFALDGNDTINIANIVSDADTKQLFARIDGGDGTDILNFQGKGESLDFASFNDPEGSGAVIQGVEQLKFVGASGAETGVTLSVADVFRLGSDATDADGSALLVLTAASSSSKNFLTATLSDFTPVGDTNAYTITGADAAKVGVANYSKFQGTYYDHAGPHEVTVLVQGYFILG